MADGLAPAQHYEPVQRRRGSRVPTPVWLLLMVGALALGYVGHDYLAEAPVRSPLAGRETLTTEQLDEPVAVCTYGEETFTVTARDALGQESSLEAAATGEGTYAMPSAEAALAAARSAIVHREVEAQGITVSDEEVDAYVEQTFGTLDYASLAAAYSMDEETARARLRESAEMAKLREAVVTTEVGEVPAEPAAPEGDDPYTGSAEYASYIFALVGDEWNAEAGSWASLEGPYASQLKDYDIRSDYATYDAARAAYYLAYQSHDEAVNAAAEEWGSYVNNLLDQAEITLVTLAQ